MSERSDRQRVERRPRVVIVGGGFGGLHAARGLAGADCDIAIFDRNNYHLFQPLLYQVAAAVLSPADIAQPIRKILNRQRNVHVYLGEITDVDLERRVVRHRDGELSYDYLVLAAGATHSYFGNDAWRRFAPGLKTVDDALEIRRRVLLAFEEAELEADSAARRAKLTFVVVGAGPTGVELAGALKEIAARTIPRDFRHVDTTTARVILLEGADRVLPAMTETSSRDALASLRELGVEVRTGAFVTSVDESGVCVGEDCIAAGSVLWAAGVQASPLAEGLGAPIDRAGRVCVEPDLSVPGHPEVFVVGDLATVTDERTGEPVPGLAPAAIQGGQHVARLIREDLSGGRRDPVRRPFRYRDKGTMATIGRNHAVAEVFGGHFSGVVAWLLWSVVHVATLVTFRAKVFVLLGWVWNYVAFQKGARLITGSPPTRVKRALARDEG